MHICSRPQLSARHTRIAGIEGTAGIAEILVGVIVVSAKKEFHGIGGAAGMHALCIIHTSAGWYVVEPQNGQYTELEKYTNPIIKYIF